MPSTICVMCHHRIFEDYTIESTTGRVYDPREGGWIRGWKVDGDLCESCSNRARIILEENGFPVTTVDIDV